jgi:DNA-binding beta-propeller fold protein YncE
MKNYVKRISLCLGFASLTFAQTTTAPIYQMSIVAGVPSGNSLGDNGAAVNGIVSAPQGIAVDASGNVYISDNTNSRIRRIDGTTGVLTTLTNSNISNPNGLAFDSKGDLIVAENGNNGEIVRVTPDGKTSTVLAGTNVSGTFGGDGQYAYNSVLNSPGGVAVDKNDNIYIADTSNNRVRMIKNVNNCIYTPGTQPGQAANFLTNTCTIVTIAGNGNTVSPQVGTSCSTTGTPLTCAPAGTNTVGDGGPALAARINGPYGIAVTPDGSTLYVAQNGDHRIRSINMLTGIISTVIGNCTAGGTPVIVPCTSGNFGNSTSGQNLGDGRLATQATTNSPRGLYLDSVNNLLYFADASNNRIRVITLSTGIVTTVIGGGGTAGDSGSGTNSGLLTSLSLNTPYGVWVQNGLIYFVEQGNNRVRVADPVAQTVKTLVAQIRSTGSGGPATLASLGFATTLGTTASPRVGVDPAGNVYVVEASTNKIRKVTPDGIINEWAGTGVANFSGDGSAATAARLSAPQSIAFDSAGNAYIADTGNNRIRKVDTNGIITTVVGRGSQVTSCSAAASAAGTCVVDKSNYVGDGGTPANALLSAPQGVAVDSLGNLVIADSGHNAIRYADLTNNVIKTIGGGVPAGIPDGPTDGRSGLGSSGQMDGLDARYGLLNNPRGVAVDANGNIYVADYANSHVSELVPTNLGGYAYSMFTFYGSGSSSGTTPNIPTGTGAPSVPARIRISSNNATSVAVDAGNNIYFALAADSRVHIISADHSKVYVVAGGGSNDTGLIYTSSNGLNTQTPAVTGVAVDAKGVVYTADRTGVVRRLICTANCLPLH